MPIDRKTVVVFAGAAILRLLVFVAFPTVPDFLTSQVEISTPISSYKRLKEGLFLYQRGASPYDGGVYHQAPLLLILFEFIPPEIIFTAVDLLSGFGLYSITEHVRLDSPRARAIDSTLVAALYLLNPFTIFTCFGRSTNVFTNAAIILAMSNAVVGNLSKAMLALSLATNLSLYPVLLLPPLALLSWASPERSDRLLNLHPSTIWIRSLNSFIKGWGILSVVDYFILGGKWHPYGATYGAQISVTDLTPNVGLWWYFFIEIFDSFRNFFIGVFWLLLASYVGALTIRLNKQPLFVIISMLGLFVIFKPYPSISDVSLYFSFLPLYKHILPCECYAMPAFDYH